MLEDTLKIGGRISDKRIERLKRDVLLISVQEFCTPEFLIAEEIRLAGAAAGKREPLHVVGFTDVIVGRIIKWRMGSCSRNDCHQMWRRFLCRRPLIKSCVGAAPHCNLAIAERLLRQPFYNVVSIARFICKRLKLATGV